MLRWLFRLLVIAALAGLLYYVGYLRAPDGSLGGPTPELLAANLPARAGQPEVRVLAAKDIDHAVLTINGFVRMDAVTMQMQTRSGQFRQSVAVDVTPTGQGIKIGAEVYVRVRLKNLDSQPLRLSWGAGNDQITMNISHEIEIYGTHVVHNNRKIPKLRILARLPIEEYLYGVVAGEVPARWNLEALRAQAVASRSFAYFEVRSRQNEEYDVRADTSSQVWRPSIAVEPAVKRAVDSTTGVVITEKNSLIKTFFHSECGGYTADAMWVFTRTPILALSGVRCPRCSDLRNKPTTWSVAYTREELEARLRRAGLLRQPGNIRVVQALDAEGRIITNRTRAVTVEITMTGGHGPTVRIPANKFREAIGNNRQNIASTYLAITGGNEPRITFSGLGWGHGVGMCQYGASYAADHLGYNFLDILALYYPGSKPVRLW